MPLYRCVVKKGLLSEEQRHAFAREITEVHCSVTAAPRSFVNVQYTDASSGELPDGLSAQVFGTIRAGRNDDQKAAIKARLTAAFAALAGVGEEAVAVTTTDIPASWVMEGGRILPEPGAEDDWFAEEKSAKTEA